MVAHWFYHLQHSSLEAVLPDILEKVRGRGWRALLKIGPTHGEPTAELARLDKYLWTYKQASFLAHGCDEQPLAEKQPILLSRSADQADGREIVVLVNGASDIGLEGVQRCITILDGQNEQDRIIARKRWKPAKDQGLETAYWRQDDTGRWMKPDL